MLPAGLVTLWKHPFVRRPQMVSVDLQGARHVFDRNLLRRRAFVEELGEPNWVLAVQVHGDVDLIFHHVILVEDQHA